MQKHHTQCMTQYQTHKPSSTYTHNRPFLHYAGRSGTNPRWSSHNFFAQGANDCLNFCRHFWGWINLKELLCWVRMWKGWFVFSRLLWKLDKVLLLYSTFFKDSFWGIFTVKDCHSRERQKREGMIFNKGTGFEFNLGYCDNYFVVLALLVEPLGCPSCTIYEMFHNYSLSLFMIFPCL